VADGDRGVELVDILRHDPGEEARLDLLVLHLQVRGLQFVQLGAELLRKLRPL
jgi:hypothetical protein